MEILSILLIPFKLVISIVCFALKIVFWLFSIIIMVIMTPFALVATIVGTILSIGTVASVIYAWFQYSAGNMEKKEFFTILIVFPIVSALFFFSCEIRDFIYEKAQDISEFFGDKAEEIWW